ncbi:phosphate ABC transporter ATPase [Streptococcus ictaluri]|nr:hypothetical protein [Streptococcus ictaluri]
MKLDICKKDYSLQWGGTYFLALVNYPKIEDWELERILAFYSYEKYYHRKTDIFCEDLNILSQVQAYLKNHSSSYPFKPSQKNVAATFNELGESIYCNLLSHTCTVKAARGIFELEKIMSATKVFHSDEKLLENSRRNAAGDPSDYFKYVMLGWSNTISGYRLAMERFLERSPKIEELHEKFLPGISFHFKYSDILDTVGYVFDGYHPAKVETELSLDKLYACIIPLHLKSHFRNVIPKSLYQKVHYINYEGEGLYDWSDKVYQFVAKFFNETI